MHKPCLPFDNHIVSCGLSIGSRLTIPCADHVSKRVLPKSSKYVAGITSDRSIDESGIDLLAVLVPEAHRSELPRDEILNQYVRAFHKLSDNLQSFGCLKVHRDGPLISIHSEEVC